jgi:hypothetical protein
MKPTLPLLTALLLAIICGALPGAGATATKERKALHLYTLSHDGTSASYDEALAVTSLQGIINRESPDVYLLSRKKTPPQFWLDLLGKEGRWLEGRKHELLAEISALVKLAGSRLKGAVIWDPAVPASVNVATTIAGIHDAIVLSPEMADRYLAEWRLPVLKDLRGLFTGAETGSKKNDAYRWAIREYLAKGLCSSHLLCLFEDSFSTRTRGDIGYVDTRDWAVKNRAFVFDLSPWGDERPADDPGQRPGLDLETYRMILAETLRHSAGKHMTELTGFFAFSKYSRMPDHQSAHEPIPTEWETVWLISPYNCYQNTISSDCFNQSLHSQAPRQPLQQHRAAKPVPLENKTYVCLFMADYDSAAALYEILPNHWHNADRGKIPLAWGINPNLLETYPDLIAYFYSTASPADTFTADACAAGYVNPSRIRREYLPLFVQHNQRFFREAGMTLAPMVLDKVHPSPEVKDAFRQFAPDGFATDVQPKGYAPYVPDAFSVSERHVWKGMPVLPLEPGQDADVMANAIAKDGGKLPAFHLFRIVWKSPDYAVRTVASLRQKCPAANVEVLDPYNFFALFKQYQERQGRALSGAESNGHHQADGSIN